MNRVWHVEMLGTFRAKGQDVVVSRFRTRRVALLLAFLSVNRNRVHSRDEVAELLWPDSDLQVGRRNLRQALLSLRHALEPPPLPSGSILQTMQSGVQLNTELVTTDIGDFESLVSKALETGASEERFDLLRQAVALYKGELLPGFDELWVLNERYRMEDLYVHALRTLIADCEKFDRADEAIHYLRLALAKDPLTERWHTALMRQYLKTGRPSSALTQYAALKAMLAEQLNCEPDSEARELAARARREAGASEPPVSIASEASTPAETEEPEPVAEQAREAVRLPVQLTRLFGRQAEIDELVRHLEDGASRLTTILGPAGTGKTRLSVEVGKTLASKGGWNVWFVPLADIDNAALLTDRILETVKPQARDRGQPLEQIRDALKGDKSLLILDNFEHILGDGAPMVRRLLETIPAVFYIVTSRQSLKLEGEREFPLHPLPIPSISSEHGYDTAADLADLAEFASVQMFVDRCQAIRPDVQLTLHNARHFATICSKLEGIPLAIEIAAGLSNSFAPAQMVKHLEKRLTALTSRRRDITPRHRSLRVAIDYGYGILSPKLQRFFAALSVFRGGFTVAAANEICYRATAEEPSSSRRRHDYDQCLSTILDLQERSLLRAEENSLEEAELRFRMLEIFREYGEECLDDSEYQLLRERHAHHFLASVAPEGELISAEERAQQHIRIEADYHNYIAALEYLFQKREVGACIKLLSALATVWDVRGTKGIEQNYIRQISQLPEIDQVAAEDRVQLLRMLGTTYLRNSDFKAAYQACSDALEVALPTGIGELIAKCYFGMALCAGYLGQTDLCIDLCGKVLEHAPSSNGVLLERTHVSVGSAHWSRGELDKAEIAFSRAREVSQAFREGEPDALILAHLAGVYLDQKRFDEAMTVAGEGIRISRRLRNEISLSACLSQVARYHRLKENFPAAVATSHEALLKGRAVAISMLCLEAIRCHALILADMHRYEASATLIAATQGMETMEKLVDRREAANALAEIREHLSPEAYERAWAHGLAMDIDEAFRLALRYK